MAIQSGSLTPILPDWLGNAGGGGRKKPGHVGLFHTRAELNRYSIKNITRFIFTPDDLTGRLAHQPLAGR